MPVQHTVFGHPVRLQIPPRRFQFLFVVILFVITSLTLFGPPSSASIPTVEEIKDTIKNPKLPEIPHVYNPFAPAAHKPPVQANSTSGDAKWYSDWKWRNPFSSSITLDENRAVLPPLKTRPPIYTFYDASRKQAKEITEAENKLLLAWRRAWWAQGFKPQVLSRAEAQKNPLYETLQRLNLDHALEVEFTRWLAWGHMGSGILANWLALPMATYDNPLLTMLRRAEYPKLTRIESLSNGVFFGEKTSINDAIKLVLDHPYFKNTTAHKDKLKSLAGKDGGVMINLIDKSFIDIDTKGDGIAYYSADNIASKYKAVQEKLVANNTQVEGLNLLAQLINSHLHTTWQNSFPDGIAILKPLPEHTTALTFEAIEIARNITQCSQSPSVSSCPPNRPKCKPCVSASPLKIQLLPHFRNTSSLFTIGTVPHPYTLASLHHTRDNIDAAFLRRHTDRDPWILAATQELLGTASSGQTRVVKFKEAVAHPTTGAHSLWLTAERESQADLDWIFGFSLPQKSWDGQSETPVPGPERRPPPPPPLEGIHKPNDNELQLEKNRVEKARSAIKSKDRRMQSIVDMVEKWNLADTEAWRFARAWSARRRVERRKWEEEEDDFAGAEKKAGSGGRWSD